MASEGSQDVSRVIITIDGPAGTGKSTVAHRLAEGLGLEFLDTGAMYRAAALIAIEHGIEPTDGPALALKVSELGMRFDWTVDPPCLRVAEHDVSQRIRDLDVSGIVSTVAAQRSVREVLVHRQHMIADAHPRLVTEGRDQGSVVFPDAPLRFYLDANVSVRADRREAQFAASGKTVDRSEVITDIQERDRVDAARTDGPLIRPEGAIVVDTTTRSIEEVVAFIESTARKQLPEAGFRS